MKTRLAYFEDLTTMPVVTGLDGIVKSAQVRRTSLAEVREMAQSGEVSIALLPVVDLFQIPQFEIIPASCVAAAGASRLFMVWAKKLPTEINRVLVDSNDFGAMQLAQLMFAKKLMIRPEFYRSEKPIDPASYDLTGDDGFDATVLVGGKNFKIRKDAFPFHWDLTLAWYEYSRLPFVIHAWGVRRGTTLGRVDKELTDTARRNDGSEEVWSRTAEKLTMTTTSVRAVYEKALFSIFGTTTVTALRRYAQELTQSRIMAVRPIKVHAPASGTGRSTGI